MAPRFAAPFLFDTNAGKGLRQDSYSGAESKILSPVPRQVKPDDCCCWRPRVPLFVRFFRRGFASPVHVYQRRGTEGEFGVETWNKSLYFALAVLHFTPGNVDNMDGMGK